MDEEKPYLVMELLEGQSLRTLMEKGAIAPRRAASFAAQIAEGLSATHARGIIHRDLKPENVFVNREGKVKVLDFGLAKHRIASGVEAESLDSGWSHDPSATLGNVVMGIVGYLAPEQINGETVDGRTDIFALGTIL